MLCTMESTIGEMLALLLAVFSFVDMLPAAAGGMFGFSLCVIVMFFLEIPESFDCLSYVPDSL